MVGSCTLKHDRARGGRGAKADRAAERAGSRPVRVRGGELIGSGFVREFGASVHMPRGRSSFTQSAGEPHYAWGLWIVGYLYKTKDLGITYGGSIRIPPGLSSKPANFDENGHDSSWGTRARPLGGFVIFYLNGAIDWSAKAVKLVPDSTLEAEQAQASRACKAGIREYQCVCFSDQLDATDWTDTHAQRQ